MWEHSVSELVDWLSSTLTDFTLRDMLSEYLLAQDTKPMVECLHVHSTFHHALAKAHDKLGWDNFVEGRVATIYVEAASQSLPPRSRLTPESWGRQFVHRLMVATHKQWLYRNSHVHYAKLDGLTEQQHDAIFRRCQELLEIDPADLLERHQYLLDEDFTELGEGSAINRQHWIASMDSAIAAAEWVRSGRQCLGNPGLFPHLEPSP